MPARPRPLTLLLAASALVAMACVASAPSGAAAQGLELRAGDDLRLGVGGRVQTQLVHSSVDEAPAVDFLVRRARLELDLEVAEGWSGSLEADFSDGDASIRDAWVRMAFSSAFRVTAGRFKRPFDRFELTSSTLLPVIERDGRIPGLERCAGVGRLCSLSRLTGALEYADRDVGVMLDGRAGGRVRWALALTNGTGDALRDVNDRKSASGRVVVALGERTEAGLNASLHDYPLDPAVGTGSEHGLAWGVDVERGATLEPGLHWMAGVVGGDNWRVDPLDPHRFLAAQALASWRMPLGGDGLFEAWSPVARIGWADPSDALEGDEGLLLTPGVALWIRGRNGITANVDVYRPGEGGTEYSLKVQTTLHF